MSKNDRLEVHLWVIITVKLLVYLPLGIATFGFPLHAALFFHQETKGETHKYSGYAMCLWINLDCNSLRITWNAHHIAADRRGKSNNRITYKRVAPSGQPWHVPERPFHSSLLLFFLLPMFCRQIFLIVLPTLFMLLWRIKEGNSFPGQLHTRWHL